ncbi:MAG: hypothetical protein ACFFB3_12640 [Candidatus Hodarchaeota archaeon]
MQEKSNSWDTRPAIERVNYSRLLSPRLRDLDSLTEAIQKGLSMLEAIEKENDTPFMQFKGALTYLGGFLSYSQGKKPEALEQLGQSL